MTAKARFDARILDPGQPAQLGKIYQINAQSVGNNNGSVLGVDPVQVSEVGLFKIARNLRGYSLNSVEQHAPDIITLAIEATPTLLGTGIADSTILQGILHFGTGSGHNGASPVAVIPYADTVLDSRIIFDITAGTMLSFPASFFQLDFLYTSSNRLGFVAGRSLGPNYNVTFSLGYGQKSHATQVTMTQLAGQDLLTAGPGVARTFFRPKYATDLYFTWSDWNIAGSSPITLFFFDSNNVNTYTILYTNVSNPPNVIPWPADAIVVQATNTTTAPNVVQFLRCVSILDF